MGQQIAGSLSGGRNNLAAIAVLILLGWGLVYAPIILGLVLLAAITLVIGLMKPRLILYFALFLVVADSLQQTYYLNAPAYDHTVTISSATLFFLLALIFWGVGRLTRLDPPSPYSNTLDLPLTIFGLSGWVSLLWSPFFYDGLTQQMVCLQGLICYFAMTRLIKTPGQVEFLCKFWFCAGIFLLAIFVMSLFIGFEPSSSYWQLLDGRISIRAIKIPKYDGTRETITGLVSKFKHLSTLLSIAIPLTVVLLCTQKRLLTRRLLQVSILLMLILQILTFSRVDLAGLLVGWLTFVYLMPTWRPYFLRYQLYMMGFFIVAFAMAFLLLANFYETGFTEFQIAYLGGAKYKTKGGTTTEVFGAGSADVRLDRTLLALEAVWETGGLGAGSGGILPRTGRPDPGTAVLEVFFQHGFGLLSYILIVWVVVNMVMEMRRSLHRCQDERYQIFLRGFCWVLAAFAFMSFLDITLYWLVLALGMAAAQAVYQDGGGLRNSNGALGRLSQ